MALLLEDININQEDLYEILKNHDDIISEKINDYKIIETLLEPYDKHEMKGFLGEHLRLVLTVRNEESNQISTFKFFVKGTPKKEYENSKENDTPLLINTPDNDGSPKYDLNNNVEVNDCLLKTDTSMNTDLEEDYGENQKIISGSPEQFRKADKDLFCNFGTTCIIEKPSGHNVKVLKQDNPIKSGENSTVENGDLLTNTVNTNTKPLTIYQQVEETDAFEKELLIYSRKVANCPKFYFKNENHIVLEDLQDQGYKSVSSASQLDFSHCKLFLKTLAEFHVSAITNIDQAVEVNEKMFVLNDGVSGKFMESAFNLLKKLFTVYESPGFLEENIEILTKLWNGIVLLSQDSKSNDSGNILCHGDLWFTNFLFKYDKQNNPTGCILIDFQLLARHPPAYDVMFFLVINFSSEFRKKHSDDLLRFYFKNFQNYLEQYEYSFRGKFSDWSEFYASCKTYEKILRIMAAACHRPIIYCDSKFVKKVYEKPEDAIEFWYGDRFKFVIEAYNMDEDYRKSINEGLEDVKQLIKEERFEYLGE